MSKPISNVNRSLDLDGTGPLRMKTIGGNRYFLFAAEDATGFIIVWATKTKGEHLLRWSEAQTGREVRRIRTGGEWATTEFKQIKDLNSFEHLKTTRGNPKAMGW